MLQNTWPLWTSMGVSFGALLAMVCSPNLARSFPHNYSLLAVFTLAESVLVGTICMVRPYATPCTALRAGHSSRLLSHLVAT